MDSATMARLTADIVNCRFISMDLEFGGLQEDQDAVKYMDTMGERYAKFKRTVERFPLLQIGWNCWFWDAPSATFRAKTHEYYLFSHHDKIICLQRECIQFLRQHGFDFNQWIDAGLSYRSLAQLQALPDPPRSENSLSQASQRFLHQQLKTIQKQLALATTSSSKSMEEWMRPASEGPMCGNGIKQVATCGLMPDQRHYFTQMVLQRHPRWHVLDWDGDNVGNGRKRRLRILEGNAEWIVQMQEAMQQRDRLAKMGFTAVMECIRSSGKPVIGHNCLLDYMFVFSAFAGALPDTIQAFCTALHDYLPLFYDTKRILHHAMQVNERIAETLGRDTSLPSAFAAFQSVLQEGPRIERNLGTSDAQPHQAGHDAYMTGVLFIRLGCLLKQDVVDLETVGMGPFRNQLFLHHFLPPQVVQCPGPIDYDIDRSLYISISPSPDPNAIKGAVANVCQLPITQLQWWREDQRTIIMQMPTIEHVTKLMQQYTTHKLLKTRHLQTHGSRKRKLSIAKC